MNINEAHASLYRIYLTKQGTFNSLPMDATSQESLHIFIERIRHFNTWPHSYSLEARFPKAIYEVS